MSNQLQGDRARPEPRALALDTPEFEKFEGWMESQLQNLEKTWSHLAAPGADRKADRIYLQKTRKPK